MILKLICGSYFSFYDPQTLLKCIDDPQTKLILDHIPIKLTMCVKLNSVMMPERRTTRKSADKAFEKNILRAQERRFVGLFTEIRKFRTSYSSP